MKMISQHLISKLLTLGPVLLEIIQLLRILIQVSIFMDSHFICNISYFHDYLFFVFLTILCSLYADQFNIPLNLCGPRYVCCFCGAQMWYEERKNKSRNERNPRFTMCCMEGKVSLPPFKQTPSLLATLLNYKKWSNCL